MNRRRILVPVNFTGQSDAALQFAVKIAKALNGMITCLHVNEEPDYIMAKFLSAEIIGKVRRTAEEALSANVNKIINAEHRTPYEVIVTTGKVHAKILEKARDLSASLIIMGKSDSDIHHPPLGLNVNRTIAQSHIPVITLSKTRHAGDNGILLPLDLSKKIEIKLLKAIEFARMLGTEVFVCSVMKPEWVSVKLLYQKRLQEIRQILDSIGLSCQVNLTVTRNSIHEEILNQAKNLNAGLILLMTQQEENWTDLFIGSTAQQVINRSEFPVLSFIPAVITDEHINSPLLNQISNPISPMQMN